MWSDMSVHEAGNQEKKYWIAHNARNEKSMNWMMMG